MSSYLQWFNSPVEHPEKTIAIEINYCPRNVLPQSSWRDWMFGTARCGNRSSINMLTFDTRNAKDPLGGCKNCTDCDNGHNLDCTKNCTSEQHHHKCEECGRDTYVSEVLTV